jgi:hypothetical protein
MLGDSHKPTRFPYVITSEQGGTVPCAGGDVLELTAAVNLNVGDVVYYSAVNGVVTKSNTIANYSRLIAGVVVGGYLTFGQVISNATEIGVVNAALAGQTVLVQNSGLVQVVADAAIAAMGSVIPGATTAGRVGAGTTAGSILGTAIQTAAGAGNVIFVDINRS